MSGQNDRLVEDIAAFVGHLRDDYVSAMMSVQSVARQIRHQFLPRDTPQDYGPDPNCKRCKGTGEEPNAQFRCPCRWKARSSALSVDRLRGEAETVGQALDALEFAQGALFDAISEEPLDGEAGWRVIQMIRAALAANGRELMPLPKEDEGRETWIPAVPVDRLRGEWLQQLANWLRDLPRYTEHDVASRPSTYVYLDWEEVAELLEALVSPVLQGEKEQDEDTDPRPSPSEAK